MSEIKCVPSIVIDPRYCKGCGLCVALCPYTVLQMSEKLTEKGYNLPEVVHPEACVGCHKCVLTCPDLAIDVQTGPVEVAEE